MGFVLNKCPIPYGHSVLGLLLVTHTENKKKMIDSVGAAPSNYPVPLTTSTRFTSGFEMSPGGSKPIWPSITLKRIKKDYK